MAKKKYIAVFAGSLLLFNGVFISLNVPSISNSTVIAAEEEPPADEEIPDAEQLEYQKKLKTLLDEADEYIKDNDHEGFDSFFEEEAETLRNLVTAIKDEYKVQKNILINRYNKVLEFAGKSSEKVPLVGTKPVVTEVEKEFTETQSIPFETVKENDATLEKGVEKEKTAGETGEKTITYKAKFKDDKEVANTRTKVKEEVTKQPVNKVVLVGTKPVVTEVEKEFTETQSIPFETVKENDATLEKGVEKEKTAGETGEKTITYKAKFKDDKEVANTRTKVKEEVTKQPVNKVVLVGTKPVVTEVEKEFTETQSIPFETVKENDATLEKGVEKEKTAGETGEKTITYKAKFKDDKEVANTRTKVKEEVTKQPVNKVVLVGTKPVVTEVEKEFTETQSIPFETVKENDATLEKGVEKEKTAGETGEKTITYKAKFKDDKEVANTRTKVKEEVTKQPVNKVVLVGTKPVVTEVEKEFTETQSIPFETVKENDATLEKGVEKEKTAGETGEKTITYKAKFKDDKEVANTRTKVKEEVTKQPVNKVVLVGTKPVVTEVEKEFTETQSIPFETVKENDATLEKGVEKEKTAGETGEKTITYKAKFKDDKEVANTRTKVKEEVTKQPVNKVVLVGTKPVVTEVEKEFTETQSIPFETVKENDATLEKGVEKEKTAGETGEKTITYKAKFKDDKEVANTRTKVKEEVTKQPVNKVVLVGTKPVVTEVEKEFTETQSIPFETVKENDATLEKGVEKEKTAGETGEKTITYKAKFKDDKEVANTRTKVKEEVTKQPVNKVVLVGTKEKTIVPGGTGVIPSPTPDVKPKPREKFSVTPEDGIQNLVVEEKPTLSVTTEEIPFSVEIRYNSKLGKGVRKEITPGENGKRRVFSKVEIINGKEKTTVISIEIEKEVKNKIIEIGTLEPKTNIARNKENLKVKNINKNEKVESVKGKLPSTGISQINTFIAGLFALIIAGVLTIFKRKKR